MDMRDFMNNACVKTIHPYHNCLCNNMIFSEFCRDEEWEIVPFAGIDDEDDLKKRHEIWEKMIVNNVT